MPLERGCKGNRLIGKMGLFLGISGRTRSLVLPTLVKLLACLNSVLEAVTLARNFCADNPECKEMSEKAEEPFPESRGLAESLDEP